MSIHLVLGGARSGKSSYAEWQVIEQSHLKRHYIATAIAFDKEMEQRIAHHQAGRDEGWQLHECPLQVASLLQSFTSDDVVLVDCLTLWLNNVIFADGNTASSEQISSTVDQLVIALQNTKAEVVLVSNEVGLGVIPMGEVTRLYVDHAGWMNQAIAKVANQVTFVAAGLPMKLKG
ncbi:bifunctional adenosylcobinamide kinase/adenosylcobinamide-phosphate guanylyltransferase [Vibrio sp. LaRot3]|uniref:bifunctional adenosylcobinamide kinase/adenosylcobinamide-phosphate guanylyltransferase n=1 Tax=Vibrio sp. LaRot3 TaxID=2998829 RepID=UPI0022CDD8AD|nr:bifunctional adenosylcobinamide kinase/adenosylcobinamide-phosphate guanylyltransferase [Vibrio sp. LaRot3]MDA0147649.1 bifunctional adenosylcobinamide kinase/adenosylcobinamide-phosphate guanylyltransferase [Vibrio sp. LaRot3]